MDLHFTRDIATGEERAAVDEILDARDSGDQEGERDSQSMRTVEGGKRVREQRQLLLPALHAIQGRIGWISPGALNYLSARLQVPPAEAYGVATFYALFSTTEQPPLIAHVCDDIACRTRGAEALCASLTEKIGPEGVENPAIRAAWKRSPCLGLCERAPAAFFQVAGEGYRDFTIAPADANQIADALSGALPKGREPGGSTPQSGVSDLCLLGRVGVAEPESLDDYRAKGGYQALRRALQIGPSEVIREIGEARLTGRGGAAFPAAVKWKAVAEAPVRPHYIVCNADESEPGTFKDRVLMEEDPFAVIEAMTIAGFACGAARGYIYIRGEYPEATRLLQRAIEQARNRGMLGTGIQGHDFTFDIEIRRGAGAYICGEETALLNSIEGKRGEPRNKPPFPVQVGLFGKPTVINNVETLVNVLPILAAGGLAYAAAGQGNSTGTRLFCVSGCVERPGVYEIPYGGTLRGLLELAGGVWNGRSLQTILIGGAAGVFLRPDELDFALTLEGARTANATLGSGVVLVFDDTIDMKPILLRIAAFIRDESCGQCVPCRVGTVRQEEALRRLIGSGSTPDREFLLLAELEKVMVDASICGLGQTAASAISSAIHRLGLFQQTHM